MGYETIQLLALDLDDTLLHPDASLSPVGRQVLLEAMDAGLEVVLASGRPFGSLPQFLLQLPGLRYAITSNGAAIHRIPDGKKLHGFTLSEQALEAILQVAERLPVLLEGFIQGIAYADARYVEDPVRYGCRPEHISYVQRTRRPVEHMPDFLRQHSTQLDSVDLICADPAEKPQFAQLIAQATQEVYITTSCRQLLEISDRRAGKDAALETICQWHGLSLSQCAAFGNAENDVPMLRAAGLGVAVANATEDCLAVADLVTRSNAEDGVAAVIQEILRQKKQQKKR